MTPERQLAAFARKLRPANAKLFRGTVERLTRQFPCAVRLVYDNYNALVVGFGPSERASEAIFSVAAFAGGVNLCFLQHGPRLKDPAKLLRGAGTKARNIRIDAASDIDKTEVKALVSQALVLATVPMKRSGEGQLIIKSVSAKQRPRR